MLSLPSFPHPHHQQEDLLLCLDDLLTVKYMTVQNSKSLRMELVKEHYPFVSVSNDQNLRFSSIFRRSV